MHVIKLKKRQILNHGGTMTIDANFDNGVEAFNKSFVFPIDETLDNVKVKVATWLEEKEESDTVEIPTDPIDLSGVVTGRIKRREYNNKKAELEEIMDLVRLGAKTANDADVKALRADVKLKYKKGYKKDK